MGFCVECPVGEPQRVEASLKSNLGLLRGRVDPTAGTDNPRCVRLRQAPLRGSKTLGRGLNKGYWREGVMGSCTCG